MSEKMTQEYYIRLYTMIFSQKLNEKFEWRILYKTIYYVSQSKIWVKNEVKQYIILYTIIYSEKLIEKWVRKMTQE